MKHLRWITLALVAAGIIVNIDLGSVWGNLLTIAPAAIVAYVIIDFVFFAVESFRVYSLGQHRYPYGAIYRCRLASMFVGHVLPGAVGADVLRVLLLDRARPGAKFYVMLLLLASRAYALLSLGLILIALLWFGVADSANLSAPGWVAMPLFALAALPLLINNRRCRRITIGFLPKRNTKFRRLAQTSYLALRHFSTPKQWSIGVTTSAITTLLVVTQFYLFAQQVGVDLSFWQWILWVPVLSLFPFLPIGFGGFGSQEAAFVLMSHSLGIPLEQLLAVSLAMHGAKILVSLSGALFLGDVRSLGQEWAHLWPPKVFRKRSA